MKTLFLFGLLTFSLSGFSQRIQNSSYETIGYIKSDGRVQNSSYQTIGYIVDGRVQDASYRTIGYIKDDRIQDGSYRTLGYVKDGRVQDGSYRTLGYVKEGRVQDSSYSTLGHFDSSIPDAWAACFFLILHFSHREIIHMRNIFLDPSSGISGCLFGPI
jgi:hypothetical protein